MADLYAKYCDIISERAVQYALYSSALSQTDEAEARRACDQIVGRVVNDLLLEPGGGEHYPLYTKYMDDPDFKERLVDYAFIKTYQNQAAIAETTAEPPSIAETTTEPPLIAKTMTEPPPIAETTTEPSPIAGLAPEQAPPTQPSIPDYNSVIVNGQSKTNMNPAVGATVLLPPVFDGGDFNRSEKRIRVTAETPIGKYRIFSRDEGDSTALYFLTASGMIDRTREYFRDEWDDDKRKWVNHLPSEAELDEVISLVAERFEKDMADPAKWAKYQHAAVLNRLDECDAHNAPVRKLRDAESKARSAEEERKRQEEKSQKAEKYDARIDEIAAAIQNGKTISVGFKENEFDGKNPVLDLFKLYGVKLPLRTKGWVNTGLAEITDDSYRYYKSKHKGNSTAFSGYLKKLREAVRMTPIEKKRRLEQEVTETEVKNKLEHELYEKLSEMFPDFVNSKYSYMRLESDEFEPLSLEWLLADRISVMHTYELNGDLCYDPMVEFIINHSERTLTAAAFQQSIPQLYQFCDEQSVWHSVDGNGNQRVVKDLHLQINEFALKWFQNIGEQGFVPVKANLVLGEDDEIRVIFDKDGNPIIPEAKTPITESGNPAFIKPDMTLPDQAIGHSEMSLYGYKNDDMYPLTAEKAVSLFDTNHPIYLLYPDNTEALALDRDEIITFSGEGLCGITHADWEMSPFYAAQMAIATGVQGSREAELLYSGENKFGIYQIPDGIDEARDFRFASMRELKAHGLAADHANYELVYTGNLDIRDTQTNLHKIYADFQGENPARPIEYNSRSVSVSDVIVLNWRGNISSHFVDSAGFVELPSFLGEETKREQPQDKELYAPDITKLETDVKAGKSISLMDLSRAAAARQTPSVSKGKPSLLARLDEAKQQVEQNRKSTAVRSKKGQEV